MAESKFLEKPLDNVNEEDVSLSKVLLSDLELKEPLTQAQSETIMEESPLTTAEDQEEMPAGTKRPLVSETMETREDDPLSKRPLKDLETEKPSHTGDDTEEMEAVVKRRTAETSTSHYTAATQYSTFKPWTWFKSDSE